jgi:hypothetical protein
MKATRSTRVRSILLGFFLGVLTILALDWARGAPLPPAPAPSAVFAAAPLPQPAPPLAPQLPRAAAPQALPPAPAPPAPPSPAPLLGPPDADGVHYALGGVQGPGVAAAWVPHRTLAHLDLGIGGAAATLLVDNWFGYHHAGVAGLRWGASAQGLSLVGEALPWAGSPPGLRAPPLPSCPALAQDGSLALPPSLNVQAFPDYPSADLVRRGRDAGAFVPSQGSAAAAAPGAPGAPLPPYVRALPWHRLWHNDTSDFPAALTAAAAGAGGGGMLFASMTPQSRARYCGTAGEGLNPDFAPATLCSGQPNPAGPSTRYPYCNRATAPVAVISLDCAMVDSLQQPGVIVWNVVTLDAGGAVVTYNGHPRWELRAQGVRVQEHDELACAGTSVYPSAPGHLFNEILPRLIHLDTVLPVHIPLLWPPGALPGALLADLQGAGLVSRERAFITQAEAPVLHRARRLYVYTSDYGSGHTPLILYTSQRVFAARLHARARSSAGAAAAATMANGIVVLQRPRGQARAVENHEALCAALRAAHPGVPFSTFVPGEAGHSFVEVSARVYGARLVVGPHGANMNNIMGMREGAWVVELGYSDMGSAMPSDYFCLARNLGLRYWLSMADSGGYGSGIVANVADVLEIARQAFAQG